MKHRKLGLVAACGALVLTLQNAHAITTTAQLMLDDPSTVGVDKIIADNSALDLEPAVGVIVYSGSVGSFIVNVSTGTSAPAQPAPYPHLDLTSVDISSGVGKLLVGFTDVDQTAANAAMTTSVGG